MASLSHGTMRRHVTTKFTWLLFLLWSTRVLASAFFASGKGFLIGRSTKYFTSSLLKTFPRGGKDEKENQKDNSEIPFRKYGYRSVPFSWEELHEIIVKKKDLAKLSRSVQQEQIYQRNLTRLREEWLSTKDYILYSKFNFLKEKDPDTGKLKAIVDTSKEKNFALQVVPNDYPYYCEEGIEHWIVWKLGSEKIKAKEIDDAMTFIRNKFQIVPNKLNHNDDMIYWENPPGLKSLPEIDHIHILFRRKESKIE